MNGKFWKSRTTNATRPPWIKPAMAPIPSMVDVLRRRRSPIASGKAPGNNPATTARADSNSSCRKMACKPRVSGGIPGSAHIKIFPRVNMAAPINGNGSRSLSKSNDPNTAYSFLPKPTLSHTGTFTFSGRYYVLDTRGFSHCADGRPGICRRWP
ncbi:MAG: hypothetical protein LZF86_80030 [Nitrospira sp.]|nr:MAG: hypothetical protein LZF86_80030 [Nitrospira sp.]